MFQSYARVLKPRLAVLLWTCLGASALLLVVAVMNRVSDEHLRGEAEHAALEWADHLARSVPEIDMIFDGDPPGAKAQEHLSRLRSLGDVFRFEFYDARGLQLLESDSLSGSGVPREMSVPAREVARGGPNRVELARGDGRARPQWYSEAYVPVRLSGTTVGAAKVYVDQSARQARIANAFRSIAAAVTAMLLALFGAGLLIWRARLQRERRAKDKMSYLARHDPLTGALNRASFVEAVAVAAARGSDGGPGFAVLCIDLAGFKDVNDAHGHAIGDEVLRQAAERLRDVGRNADLVARLGGDEFALLQTGVLGSDDVAVLAQRSVEALSAPYYVGSLRIGGGACVGVAMHGVDAFDAAGLVQRADLALHGVRVRMRSGFGFFDPELDRRLQTRRELTRELAEALDNGGLMLHFQPQLDADGVTLQGYEALLRWLHPTRGLVSPSEFIPLAEASGLIVPLGRWVLRQACAEAVRWPGHLSVAVNLSAAQFGHDDTLVQEVTQTLIDTGLAPQRLELEITESMLIADTAQVLSCLDALHAIGVRIAMDDFGTGYSSLAYLWRFPFDKVKIDRAFIQSLHDDEKVTVIVRSIISLAHSLNIRICAEGVETAPQAEMLRQHGCDELQGFLLGRPMPADRLLHRASAEKGLQARRLGLQLVGERPLARLRAGEAEADL